MHLAAVSTKGTTPGGELPTRVPHASTEDKSRSALAKSAKPPALPPKQGKQSSSQLLPDTLHTRLLPKEGCVTNILYSRRLPSPPVFRRRAEHPSPARGRSFHRDDHFAEEKKHNYYEEVDKRDLFCPLCNCAFGYSFGLECHLLSAHQDILKVAKNEEQFLQEVNWCQSMENKTLCCNDIVCRS